MPSLQTTRRFDASTTSLVSHASHEEAAGKGTVLHYHGLWGSKEINLAELEAIASRGFLAIGVDQWGHGERQTPETRGFLNGEHPEFPDRFVTALRRGVDELPSLVDQLASAGLLVEGRLGIAGISMGGYLTYAAITAEPRIRAAVSIVGSPAWRVQSEHSPAHHPEAFGQIALLSMNASLDSNVPASNARQFHEYLDLRFPESTCRRHYHEYPLSGHVMRGEDWADCIGRTLDWLEQWL